MKIEQIIGIDGVLRLPQDGGLTLVVYYTNARCWQFGVIGKDQKLWQINKIFYTADAAEVAGKMWIGQNF